MLRSANRPQVAPKRMSHSYPFDSRVIIVISVGTKGKLYTTGDIAGRLGVSRQRAYAIANRDSFPESFDDLPGGSVWLVGEVETWIGEHRPARARSSGGDIAPG
jgi:prophage regulatory protein